MSNNNLSVIRVQMFGPLLFFLLLADHSDGLSAILLAQGLQRTSMVLKCINQIVFSSFFPDWFQTSRWQNKVCVPTMKLRNTTKSFPPLSWL